MRHQEQLEAFIAKSFRSVWALEILRFLDENAGRAFGAEELITELHLSQSVIRRSIKDLIAARAVVLDKAGSVALASDKHASLVQAAIRYYTKSPDKVRRLIVAQHSRV